MRPKIWFLLIFSILSQISFSGLAQGPSFEWVVQIGNESFEKFPLLQTDNLGNVYLAGEFEDTLDFDPGPNIHNLVSFGRKDIFVLKISSSGNFLWVKQIGGTQIDTLLDFEIDEFGNFFLTGYFEGTADFDPGPGVFNLTSNGKQDIYVCKLDPNGNLVWAKRIGGIGNDFGFSLEVNDSNVYFSGIFSGTVDFDPGPGVYNLSSVSPNDRFVCKLDPNGNMIFAKEFGNVDSKPQHGQWVSTHLEVDNNGSIFLAGSWFGRIDLYPGQGVYFFSSTLLSDKFMLKLDSAGNYQWVEIFEGSGVIWPHGVRQGMNGSLLSFGNFSGLFDFDPGPGYHLLTAPQFLFSFSDNYISILNFNGDFEMALQIGGGNLKRIHDLEIDSYGSIYFTGEFEGTCDFRPDSATYYLTSNGRLDAFIGKLSSQGELIWVRQMGGSKNDSSTAISITPSGEIYSAGNFSGTVDFNPGGVGAALTARGISDFFVQKMSQIVGLEQQFQMNRVKIFPNPTRGNFSIDLGGVFEYIEVQIYNPTGLLLKQRNYESSKILPLRIDGNQGLYFLKVTVESNNPIYLKVLKN
jgi:hypothetical protein